MTFIQIPRVSRAQPRRLSRINWNKSASSGLLYLPQMWSGGRDATGLQQGALTFVGGAAFAVGPYGRSISLAGGVNDKASLTASALPMGVGVVPYEFTLEVLCSVSAAPLDLSCLFSFGSTLPSTSAGVFGLLAHGGSSPFNVYFWNGSSADKDSGVLFRTNGSLQHIFATFQGTGAVGTERIFRDGVQIASVANVPSNWATSIITYGSRHSSGAGTFTGHIYKAAIYNVPLDLPAVAALTDNPWQQFEPDLSRVYFIPAAAGNSAQIAASDSSDTAALIGIPARVAQISAADTRDAAAVSASNWRTAQIAASDSADVTSLTAANWRTAQLVVTDSADSAALTGTPAAVAAIAANESSDSAAIAAEAATRAAIVATDASDSAAVVATVIRTAQIAATEASDSAALATTVTSGAAIAATDGADGAALAAVAWRTAQIVATESPDTVQIVAEGIAGTASAAINASDSADTGALATIVTTGAGIVATDWADGVSLLVSVPAVAAADTGVRHGPLPPRHRPAVELKPIICVVHTTQPAQRVKATMTLSLVAATRSVQAPRAVEAQTTLEMVGQVVTSGAAEIRAFIGIRMLASGKSWQGGQGGLVAANAGMETKVTSGLFPRDPPPTYDGPPSWAPDELPSFKNAA